LALFTRLDKKNLKQNAEFQMFFVVVRVKKMPNCHYPCQEGVEI
jgi:hypothetical protein